MLFRLVTLHHCLYWSQLNQLRCLGSSVGRFPIYTELWSAWVHKISCIDTVYMQHEAILGLVRSYVSLAGDITTPDGVILTVDSDLNGASPQFTLTCISTGGPATTVTWTRSSVVVAGSTVLDDVKTAQYSHSLIVTGRLERDYTCNVSNNKPSLVSASLRVQGRSTAYKLTLSMSNSVHSYTL